MYNIFVQILNMLVTKKYLLKIKIFISRVCRIEISVKNFAQNIQNVQIRKKKHYYDKC